MQATLRAWVDQPGQVQRIAAALHVHPQTVRYRLGQLRELLGDALDDADARFAFALALRARDAEPAWATTGPVRPDGGASRAARRGGGRAGGRSR